MSEKGINPDENSFEKIHLRFFGEIDKEMEEFKASYKSLGVQEAYNDWYTIGFYESYYDMLSCDFIDDKNIEGEILWLSGKEKPLAFLYNR